MSNVLIEHRLEMTIHAHEVAIEISGSSPLDELDEFKLLTEAAEAIEKAFPGGPILTEAHTAIHDRLNDTTERLLKRLL